MTDPEDPGAGTAAPLELQCPKCGLPMEGGFLSFDYGHTRWVRTRAEHFWQADASEHLGPRQVGVVYASAGRCRACRVVSFGYPAE
jgi:Domain of unknown function (DUF6487)